MDGDTSEEFGDTTVYLFSVLGNTISHGGTEKKEEGLVDFL